MESALFVWHLRTRFYIFATLALSFSNTSASRVEILFARSFYGVFCVSQVHRIADFFFFFKFSISQFWIGN